MIVDCLSQQAHFHLFESTAMTRILIFALLAAASVCQAFVVHPITRHATVAKGPSGHTLSCSSSKPCQRHLELQTQPTVSIWKRIGRRFNTIESAGLKQDQVLTAGLFGPIRKAHNPITYLALAFLAGLKWNWCFRNPYYWFAVGFCIKWYRARYVFKIPVWDRQPNWNNIITSKEQEKDLKAFTCKNCGSTLFIAKTREFFFEGDTGIGGLGCFTCGAKGKDNFIEDRDRIVEDVGDMDDYFEYERPLDFVSAAERRKLMKEAAGDEEKANQILLERESTPAGAIDAEVVGETVAEDFKSEEDAVTDESASDEPVEVEPKAMDEPKDNEPVAQTETPAVPKKTEKPTAPKKKKPTPPAPSADDDEDFMSLLDLD